MTRGIEKVFPGAPYHWVGDGFKVRNHFPSASDDMKRMSPFFLLDYHAPHVYAPTTSEHRGVGPHPHRGFETVTVAFEGSIAHHDSAGNGGVIRPGETQWMTAGGGVLHDEYHEPGFARAGGTLHLVQLWVNLPRRLKLTAPKYQALATADIPEAALAGGKVRVIAGSFGGTRGPAASFTPVALHDIRLGAGGRVTLEAPRAHNAALLVAAGEVELSGGARVPAGNTVIFRHDGEAVVVEALSPATLLWMAGEPIDEPLVHYGPFVMNTADEINQAVEDYHAGRFGVLAA